MPYVFTQPVVQIFSASLQAVIGWIFALYVSWWLLSGCWRGIPALKGDLMATVGMICVGMAAWDMAWKAEQQPQVGGCGAYRRTIVSLQVCQPWGIAEWFAVGFEFFIPYFLAFCTPYRRRVWAHALWGVFLFHMFLHLFSEPISRTVPTQPFVLWHWISILTLGVLALTGAASTTWKQPKAGAVAARIDVGVLMPVHSGNGHSAGGHWRTTRPANFADPLALPMSHGIAKSIHALYSGLCGCRLDS